MPPFACLANPDIPKNRTRIKKKDLELNFVKIACAPSHERSEALATSLIATCDPSNAKSLISLGYYSLVNSELTIANKINIVQMLTRIAKDNDYYTLLVANSGLLNVLYKFALTIKTNKPCYFKKTVPKDEVLRFSRYVTTVIEDLANVNSFQNLTPDGVTKGVRKLTESAKRVKSNLLAKGVRFTLRSTDFSYHRNGSLNTLGGDDMVLVRTFEERIADVQAKVKDAETKMNELGLFEPAGSGRPVDEAPFNELIEKLSLHEFSLQNLVQESVDNESMSRYDELMSMLDYVKHMISTLKTRLCTTLDPSYSQESAPQPVTSADSREWPQPAEDGWEQIPPELLRQDTGSALPPDSPAPEPRRGLDAPEGDLHQVRPHEQLESPELSREMTPPAPPLDPWGVTEEYRTTTMGGYPSQEIPDSTEECSQDHQPLVHRSSEQDKDERGSFETLETTARYYPPPEYPSDEREESVDNDPLGFKSHYPPESPVMPPGDEAEAYRERLDLHETDKLLYFKDASNSNSEDSGAELGDEGVRMDASSHSHKPEPPQREEWTPFPSAEMAPGADLPQAVDNLQKAYSSALARTASLEAEGEEDEDIKKLHTDMAFVINTLNRITNYLDSKPSRLVSGSASRDPLRPAPSVESKPIVPNQTDLELLTSRLEKDQLMWKQNASATLNRDSNVSTRWNTGNNDSQHSFEGNPLPPAEEEPLLKRGSFELNLEKRMANIPATLSRSPKSGSSEGAAPQPFGHNRVKFNEPPSPAWMAQNAFPDPSLLQLFPPSYSPGDGMMHQQSSVDLNEMPLGTNRAPGHNYTSFTLSSSQSFSNDRNDVVLNSKDAKGISNLEGGTVVFKKGIPSDTLRDKVISNAHSRGSSVEFDTRNDVALEPHITLKQVNKLTKLLSMDPNFKQDDAYRFEEVLSQGTHEFSVRPDSQDQASLDREPREEGPVTNELGYPVIDLNNPDIIRNETFSEAEYSNEESDGTSADGDEEEGAPRPEDEEDAGYPKLDLDNLKDGMEQAETDSSTPGSHHEPEREPGKAEVPDRDPVEPKDRNKRRSRSGRKSHFNDTHYYDENFQDSDPGHEHHYGHRRQREDDYPDFEHRAGPYPCAPTHAHSDRGSDHMRGPDRTHREHDTGRREGDSTHRESARPEGPTPRGDGTARPEGRHNPRHYEKGWDKYVEKGKREKMGKYIKIINNEKTYKSYLIHEDSNQSQNSSHPSSASYDPDLNATAYARDTATFRSSSREHEKMLVNNSHAVKQAIKFGGDLIFQDDMLQVKYHSVPHYTNQHTYRTAQNLVEEEVWRENTLTIKNVSPFTFRLALDFDNFDNFPIYFNFHNLPSGDGGSGLHGQPPTDPNASQYRSTSGKYDGSEDNTLRSKFSGKKANPERALNPGDRMKINFDSHCFGPFVGLPKVTLKAGIDVHSRRHFDIYLPLSISSFFSPVLSLNMLTEDYFSSEKFRHIMKNKVYFNAPNTAPLTELVATLTRFGRFRVLQESGGCFYLATTFSAPFFFNARDLYRFTIFAMIDETFGNYHVHISSDSYRLANATLMLFKYIFNP